MKRKAILLKFGFDDNELFTSGKDLGLVKYFLKSAQGGHFSDEEIVEYISSEIEKDFYLLSLKVSNIALFIFQVTLYSLKDWFIFHY